MSGKSAQKGREGVSPVSGALAPFKSKMRLAGLVLFWENLWPRLVAPICVLAVFAASGWLRLTDFMSDYVRLGFVGLLGLLFLASLVPLFGLRRSTAAARLDRLERDNQLAGRPLRALIDRQATGEMDPVSLALWKAHQDRAAKALKRLDVSVPSPRVDRRDPYALRAAVFLFFVVGLVAGRGSYSSAIVDMVRLPVAPVADIRLDAWVTPPAYTGRAPIFLTAQASDAPGDVKPLVIPEGSVFSLRVIGVADPVVRFIGDDAAPATPDKPAGIILDPVGTAAAADKDKIARPVAFGWTFGASGTISVSAKDAGERSFRFAVQPDEPPTITLSEPPGQTVRGAFRLVTEARDDYRVASARAVFSDPVDGGEVLKGAHSANPHPLVGPPEMTLNLARKNAAKKSAETFRDLSAHPWAGGPVTMVLEAKDDAGNVGKSDPIDVVIPQRPFRSPLAKMLVEQRRILAKDANVAGFVVQSIDSVADYQPEFDGSAAVTVGLRVLRNRILDARDDKDLVAALDMMWQMALAIDGGDASLAEQALREAREKLRDALKNGASPEEIAKLTEELKQALNDYMKALQQQAESNPDLSGKKQPENAQVVTPEDFQKLMDQMQEMSKLGDREAAEQLLSQLDQMLENLQTAQPSQQSDPNGQQSPMGEQMNKLADMIRKQQDLMNQTHKLTPDGQPMDGSGPSDQERQDKLSQLQKEQADLQKQLNELMQEMQKNGSKAGEQLGQAEEKMNGAGDKLGEGNPDEALGDQGQALDQMRKGAQQMAKEMAEQEGQGQGRKPGENTSQNDPLGRPEKRKGPDYGDSVKVPGEIEVQRARRVLDELRRRYSDPARPSLELDYLKRLLSPF